MAHFQPDTDVGSSPVADLPVLHDDGYANEKISKSSSDDVVGKLDSPYEKGSSIEDAYEGQQEGVTYVNGEPVIKTGEDVSNFLFDVRDDGDPALTFRSFVLGTIFAGLGAALSQVCALHNGVMRTSGQPFNSQIYLFKPVQVSVSTVFLLLLIYTFGNLWATILPRASLVEGTRLARFGPLLHFINPGAFGLKEVCMLIDNVLRPSCSYTGSMLLLRSSHLLLQAGARPCRTLRSKG